MRTLSMMQARRALAATVSRVARGKRIVLERRGKPVAALIPVEDLRLYEKLLADYEDRLDLAAARKALKEPGEVSLKELKARLGL
jgi:prevent-host-death family protein